MKSFVYVAVLSVFLSFLGLASFNALAEDIAETTPVVETPVVETPVVEEPVVETPVVEEPVVEEPVVEEPVVEEPVVEEPVVEEPVVEEPVVEEPVVEEPVVEEPVVEEPVVEEPVVETPVVEEPMSGGGSEGNVILDFLQEKVLEKIANEVPYVEIAPVNVATQNFVNEVIEVDSSAAHSCYFGSFVVAIIEGQAFDVAVYLDGNDQSKTSVLKIGELPRGVSAKFSLSDDSTFSGVLSESEVLMSLSAEAGAQKGSFNFPVIYTQVDAGGVSSVNICQLNLIVE